MTETSSARSRPRAWCRHAAAMADAGAPRDAGSDILVSNMRARRGSLSPGYVVAAICVARTADGFLAAERQLADARGRSRRTNRARRPRRGSWRGGCCAGSTYRRAFPASIAGSPRFRTCTKPPFGNAWRGNGSCGTATGSTAACSPACSIAARWRSAERSAAAGERRDETHRRHLEVLERSSTLHLVCAPSAVLDRMALKCIAGALASGDLLEELAAGSEGTGRLRRTLTESRRVAWPGKHCPTDLRSAAAAVAGDARGRRGDRARRFNGSRRDLRPRRSGDGCGLRRRLGNRPAQVARSRGA